MIPCIVMLNHALRYIVEHRVQLFKFVCIGLITFGNNFLFFQVFYKQFHWDYRIAVSLAFVLTVILHFSLHRIITFNATGRQIMHHAGKYILMLGLNYVITMIIAWFVVEILRISPSLIVVGATAVTTVINFFLMKYFVFKAKGA